MTINNELAMDQYLLIPFLVGWTSINPSYELGWTEGTRVLTHPHMLLYYFRIYIIIVNYCIIYFGTTSDPWALQISCYTDAMDLRYARNTNEKFDMIQWHLHIWFRCKPIERMPRRNAFKTCTSTSWSEISAEYQPLIVLLDTPQIQLPPEPLVIGGPGQSMERLLRKFYKKGPWYGRYRHPDGHHRSFGHRLQTSMVSYSPNYQRWPPLGYTNSLMILRIYFNIFHIFPVIWGDFPLFYPPIFIYIYIFVYRFPVLLIISSHPKSCWPTLISDCHILSCHPVIKHRCSAAPKVNPASSG